VSLNENSGSDLAEEPQVTKHGTANWRLDISTH